MVYSEWAPKMLFVVTVLPMGGKWQTVIVFRKRIFRYGEPFKERKDADMYADKLDAAINEKLHST